jgi:phosphoserine phosphatase RsbU/P
MFWQNIFHPHESSAVNRKRLTFLKTAMGGANGLANLVGVAFVQVVSTRVEPPLPGFVWENPLVYLMDVFYTPFAFAFVFAATWFYEKPLREYLDRLFEGRPMADRQALKARRRLLNEPYVTIALDLAMWGLAALLFALAFHQAGAGSAAIQRTIFNSLSVGLITITVAFFLQEHILQKRLAAWVFPDGGLSAIPGALRIRFATRLTALLVACNLLPLLSILLLYHRIMDTETDAQVAIHYMGSAILTYVLVFVGTGVVLTILVARNLTLPFADIIDSLREIRNGRFDRKIRVTTNDEIGYTGDTINEMAEGLRERERMRQSLSLAMEVQQSLLPKAAPCVRGLDIAGTSIYCEETGGDYFDYFETAGPETETIGVAVADVSDHGIPSAMLMTTVRAFLRQRAYQAGNLGAVIADVNRQLARDVEDTGRFVTLFFTVIDRLNQRMSWVNAGHDSAVIYDGNTGTWAELGRTGLPIGIAGDSLYREMQTEISPGQIIVIGTDGIWEARNSMSEMFGKRRFQDIIHRTAGLPADKILDQVVQEVNAFCYPLLSADDITLVIVKVEA